MYISASLSSDKNKVLVWERTDTHTRDLKIFKAPYFFYVDDQEGKYKTIYDTNVRRIKCENVNDYYNQKKQFDSNVTWEADITPETRILAKHYRTAEIPKLNVTFYDIEVDYTPTIGFASPRNPYAPINSISLFHTHTQTMVVLCVPPVINGVMQHWTDESIKQACEDREPLPPQFTYEFKVCSNEAELLQRVMATIENSDALVGWNSDFFDAPYLGNRIRLVLGEDEFEKLSFAGARAPYFTDVEVFGAPQIKLEVSGRIFSDYLQLYKKYSQSERPSYKLSAIEQDVGLNLPKMEYSGTLHTLYHDDFAFFVRYNIRDCEILNGFESVLGYVQTANMMYHMSCGLFQHVGGTLKLAELAIVNYCHDELNRVVNNIRAPYIDRSIEGALVLLPQIGMHKFVGSIDIKSLYPSVIRSINISPETKIGQFTNLEEAPLAIQKRTASPITLRYGNEGGITTTETKTAAEWNDYLTAKGWAVSGYGTVFDQKGEGIIPTILTRWFAERKVYQQKKKDAGKKADEVLAQHSKDHPEYVAHSRAAEYFDRMQYIFKIKLNSLYGALSNLYFRFYDLENAESVTATGRRVIKHQCRRVSEVLDGNYEVEFPLYATIADAQERGHPPSVALVGPVFNGAFQSESVIYGDTDSTYFATGASNSADAIFVADSVAELVNASYKDFMKSAFLCTPGFDSKISCEREIVSDRGIFVDKKRYILHLIDKDGHAVDDMKIMGLDTKKTTIPTAIADVLNGFIEQLLKGESWECVADQIVDYKDIILNTPDILSIGLPKGITNIEKYTKEYEIGGDTVNLPGHVAAAIFYNKCLKDFQDTDSPPITSGMKIKVFYLNRTYGRFKSIAIPTDTIVPPKWFTEEFIVDRSAHVERLVDNPLSNILKAINKSTPTRQSIFMDSLCEY